MIICAQCGERNADGTVFCGRCGVFLEWEGEKVAAPAAPSGEGRGEEAAGPVDDAVDPPAGDSGAAAGVPVGQLARTDTAAAVPDNEHLAEGMPTTASTVGSVPTGVARQPEEMRRRRTQRARRLPQHAPTGSLICGACGMPNQSERRFCARCGQPLAQAKVVRKASWWRRLLGRERVYEAGYRKPTRRASRQGSRRLGRIVSSLLLVAGIGGVAVLAGPQRGLVTKAYHAIQNRLHPEHVRPTEASASGAAKAHPAAAAFDGADTTFWAPPLAGGSAKSRSSVPWIRAEFADPIHLVALGLTPGMSVETPAFVAGTRPAEIEVSLTTGSDPVVKRFHIDDVAGFHKLMLNVRDVRSIQVAVLASKGKHPTLRTAITELEIYANR